MIERQIDNFLINAYKQIDDADVVSFDVFDTLLLRPFSEPTDVFDVLEQKYKKYGFKRERIAAEGRARRKKNEPTIDDIYAEIPSFADCMKIELNLEMLFLYRNDKIWKLYQYACSHEKKVIIVSDMYLSSTFISDVLTKNGYDAFETIFVSCEYGKSKNEGTLYNLVLERYPSSEYSIVHIGDNITSDYTQARKHGFQSLHTPKLIDKYLLYRSYREKDTKNLPGSIFVKLCADRYSCGFNNYWEQFGYEFAGPICFVFTRWIWETIQTKKHSEIINICFAARDGYLLKKIYEIFNESIGETKIKLHYIYAPRILAIVSRITNEKDLETLSIKQKTAIYEYYKTVNLKADETKDQSPEEFILHNKTRILNNAEAMLSEFDNYIKDCEIKSGETVYLIDTRTENFSAQSLIEKVVEKKITGLYYVVGDENNSFQFDSFQQERQNVYLNWQIIEYVMSAPTPPCSGINNGEPIFGDMNSYEQDRISIFKSIEKGAIEFVNDLRERNLLGLAPSELFIRNWVNNFCLNGDATDRKMFTGVKFANNAMHTEYINLDLFANSKNKWKIKNVRERFFRWLTIHPKLYGVVKATYRKFKR